MALYEAALGPEHPDVAASRSNLAGALKAQGKYEEAEAEHRAALASWEAALGPEHPHVATSRNNLANVLYAQGKYEEAEVEFRAALALLEAALGPEHPGVAKSRNNLAGVLFDRDRLTEALPLAEQAWTRRRRDDIPAQERASTAFVLARVLWAIEAPNRDRPRARALAEDALKSYERAGDGHDEKRAALEQ